MQESWEEWRRKGKLAKSTMEEREAPIHAQPKEEEGVFIPSHEIWPLQDLEGRIIRPKYGRIIRPSG
jgi:hypothetical protein